MSYQERYRARPVAVNATVHFDNMYLGGFLCTTSGTITITTDLGLALLTNHPVTAGVYTPLPFSFNSTTGGSFVAAGGASGLLGA